MAADDCHGLTPKQEAFACAYVETGNASEAYRRAGYSTRQSTKAINDNASKLLTKVLPRVEQLQTAHTQRHNITVGSITQMLKDDRELARSLNQPAAAVSASMGLAKLHGLIIERGKSYITSDSTHRFGEPISETARWLKEMFANAEEVPSGEKLQ